MRNGSEPSRSFRKRQKTTPHLLLVEDDETDVIFVKRTLEQHGATVPLAVARDGAEALKILRRGDNVRRPYVILTDLNMPGMSGHEMMEVIRADEELKDSVIFVLSSSRLEDDIDRAYEYNAAGYITKDAPTAELSESLRMIVDYCKAVHLPA